MQPTIRIHKEKLLINTVSVLMFVSGLMIPKISFIALFSGYTFVLCSEIARNVRYTLFVLFAVGLLSYFLNMFVEPVFDAGVYYPLTSFVFMGFLKTVYRFGKTENRMMVDSYIRLLHKPPT